MNDKIRPTHLERVAYVYIRQSTLHQVRNHQESRRRQYDLQTRARQLGFRQVEVIDELLTLRALAGVDLIRREIVSMGVSMSSP